MADIKNELESIENFLTPVLPADIAFRLQYIPSTYQANDFSIQYINDSSENETGYHYRIDRLFQLTYFGETSLDCITVMDSATQLLNNKFMIPLIGTTRYLRMGSFSFSQPFKTESGIYAVICMLEVSLREARPQPTYEKINNVEVRLFVNNKEVKEDQ